MASIRLVAIPVLTLKVAKGSRRRGCRSGLALTSAHESRNHVAGALAEPPQVQVRPDDLIAVDKRSSSQHTQFGLVSAFDQFPMLPAISAHPSEEFAKLNTPTSNIVPCCGKRHYSE